MKDNANFGDTLEIGLDGEKLLKLIAEAYIARGENAVEVKNQIASETSNVYIERESRGKPSGIATSTSPYWALVLDGPGYNRDVVIIIRTNRLHKICDQSGRGNVKGGDSDTSRGYLLPVTRLLKPMKTN